MRTIPQHIWDVWNAGGAIVGTNKAPHGRVTVEIDWTLTPVSHATGDSGGWVLKSSLETNRVNSSATDGVNSVWLDAGFTEFTRYDADVDAYTSLSLTDAPPTGFSDRMVYDPTGPYIWRIKDGNFYRYSVEEDVWTAGIRAEAGFALRNSDLQEQFAAGYRNGAIIFAGGYGDGGNALVCTTLYDVSESHFTALAELDTPLAEIGGAWSGDKFYIFGGWSDDANAYVPLGRVYEPVNDVWTEISVPYDADLAGDPAVIALDDGTIVVAGGFGDNPTSAAWLYDTALDSWTQLPDIPFSSYMTGVAVDDVPYVWYTYEVPDPNPPSPVALLHLPIVEGAPQGVGSYTKAPVRWWQRSDNSQIETEVPNIESIQIDRSIDQDAATCTLTLSNQWHLDNGEVLPGDPELGEPGFFSFSRGESAEALSRWNQTTNEWNEILIPDALIRTYQGYGGKTKGIRTAEDDGNIVLTGVWLVDSVRLGTSGKVELHCRDMAKLLIEQQIYPPLAPASLYPLMYSRWGFHDLSSAATRLSAASPALFGDSQPTPLLTSGVTNYNGSVPQPDYPDYEGNEPGNGYWLAVSDGHIYAMGNNAYYGQVLTSFTVNPVIDLESTVNGHGYYVMYEDGTIHTFGDATYYGNAGIVNPLAMARNHLGTGYWVVNIWGTVVAHGPVSSHGNCPTAPNPTNFWLSEIAVDIAGDPVGDGYWCLTNQGHVYAFGSATYYGQPYGSTYPPTGAQIKTFRSISAHPDGGGYWCIDQIGNVHAYGAARHYGQLAGQAYAAIGGNLPFQNPDFPDYMCELIPTPSGNGYWLLGVSGGVYPFGDAVGLGALNSPYEAQLRVDGNYFDYSEIIKDLALWAGFWLYPELDGDNTPSVYGNIETTGAFASDRLDEAIFDKKPVIDPMTKLKEIVGYLIWVDDEGAFHFESPNIYSEGNFDELGVHTDTIPEIDERIQLTDYTIEYADKSARSEIIISTTDPTAALDDTITTRFTPATAEILRGMIKPAMWVNGIFTIKREQEIMAELIALFIWLAQRQGSVTCLANPAIQINDQVRIFERVTGETYIHYVRGISSNMDLVQGTYLTSLTTHWMGDGTQWAVDLGLVPYEFTGITTGRDLTYNRATDDLGGAATPDLTYDGNLATAWRPPGGTGQLVSNAVEYIEYDLSGTINRVGIYPYGASEVWISVMQGGVWQGGGSIPYTPVGTAEFTGGNTPSIPFVYHSSSVSSETARVITLPSTYTAQKVRVTLSGFSHGVWGPFYYKGGLREVKAGLT